MVGFWNVLSLAVFQSSFLLFVTFDTCWESIYLLDTKLLFCRFQVISSLTLSSKVHKKAKLVILTKLTRQPWNSVYKNCINSIYSFFKHVILGLKRPIRQSLYSSLYLRTPVMEQHSLPIRQAKNIDSFKR